MQVELDEIKASKQRDVYKINFNDRNDYNKAKYMLSRLYVKWCPNDFTKTLYFVGKKL